MRNEPLETIVEQGDPRDLQLLERNARSMKERDFRQLVDNISRDGVLLGAVIVREHQGRLVVLSGNHRVKASIAAGLPTIPWIRVVSEITDARALANQLSQNAIVGQDDPNVLRELYASLEVFEQQYSGLTDVDLGLLDEPAFDRLRIGPPKYEEVLIAFLPEDRADFEEELSALSKRAGKMRIWKARFADYASFYEATMQTKDVRNITNDAVTIAVMVELAMERLAQIEAEEAGQSADQDTESVLVERDPTASTDSQD